MDSQVVKQEASLSLPHQAQQCSWWLCVLSNSLLINNWTIFLVAPLNGIKQTIVRWRHFVGDVTCIVTLLLKFTLCHKHELIVYCWQSLLGNPLHSCGRVWSIRCNCLLLTILGNPLHSIDRAWSIRFNCLLLTTILFGNNPLHSCGRAWLIRFNCLLLTILLGNPLHSFGREWLTWTWPSLAFLPHLSMIAIAD